MNTQGASMEVHTSDLTKPCLRAVDLRLRGKAIGTTQSAKAWGLLWHEACATLHREGGWNQAKVDTIVGQSWADVLKRARAENSPPSEAVCRDAVAIMGEVAELLPLYGKRVAPLAVKVIGTELPVRCTFDVDGEPVEFASHLDLLCRLSDGTLSVWDWKGGDDAPSHWELARNMQMGMYGYALKHGSVCVDGEWVEFDEWPSVYWVQVKALRPFGRKTTTKELNDETGTWDDVTYAKGEERPLTKVMLHAGVYPEGEAEILARFAEHVRLRRHGLMVATPGEHCRFCDSVKFCNNFGGEGE